MSASDLSMLAGAILSLMFSYLPGLNAKYDALRSEQKRLIMLGLVVLVAIGAYALACAGYDERLGYSVECSDAGLFELVKAVIAAVVANQGVYNLTKK